MIQALVMIWVSVGLLALVQRNWLNLAHTERGLARTDGTLAEAWRLLNRPEDAAERERLARGHDRRAARFVRRAWPFKADVDEAA